MIDRQPVTVASPQACVRTVDPAEHPAHFLQVAVIQEPDGRVVLVLLEGHCGWWGDLGQPSATDGDGKGISTSQIWRNVFPCLDAASNCWVSGNLEIRNEDVPANELVTSRRPLRCSPRSTPRTRLSSESSCFFSRTGKGKERGDVRIWGPSSYGWSCVDGKLRVWGAR